MIAAIAIAASVHVTHAGDTYSSIAQSAGVSVQAVEQANQYAPTEIPIGVSIAIPGSGTSYTVHSTPQAAQAPMSAPVTPPVHHVASQSVSAPSGGHTSGSGYEGCVIQHESGGNPHAVNSSSGAGGLYQFLPSTWQSLGYSGSPQNAPVSQQNAAFQKLHSQMGSSPWITDGC